MRKIRMIYKKTGRAVYISHLDIMRVFQRAFSRAGILIKHTEGFNPHPYISIALPLSLGYTGECELMDIILQSGEAEGELVEKLNAALPEGVEAVTAYEGGRPVRDIAYSEFLLSLRYDEEIPDGIEPAINELFKRDNITVIKRTKRGEKECDIAPMIASLEVSRQGDAVLIRAHLASGASTLNPEYIIRAIEKYAPSFAPSFCEFTHKNVYDKEFKEFR